MHSTYTIYTHMRSLYKIMYIHTLAYTHIWVDAHLSELSFLLSTSIIDVTYTMF